MEVSKSLFHCIKKNSLQCCYAMKQMTTLPEFSYSYDHGMHVYL